MLNTGARNKGYTLVAECGDERPAREHTITGRHVGIVDRPGIGTMRSDTELRANNVTRT